ncbi:22031_t:CDS:2 [Entrophospora sp. SA101]|nr:22031_t:CDS:2 [Entrophospora sp. SA101]
MYMFAIWAKYIQDYLSSVDRELIAEILERKNTRDFIKYTNNLYSESVLIQIVENVAKLITLQIPRLESISITTSNNSKSFWNIYDNLHVEHPEVSNRCFSQIKRFEWTAGDNGVKFLTNFIRISRNIKVLKIDWDDHWFAKDDLYKNDDLLVNLIKNQNALEEFHMFFYTQNGIPKIIEGLEYQSKHLRKIVLKRNRIHDGEMSSRVPNEELPILEALICIRNRLHALKKDRANYIRASAVIEIYEEVTEQVRKLNEIRELTIQEPKSNNRVNDVLDDETLKMLRESESNISDELLPVHQRLVEIKRLLGDLGLSGSQSNDIRLIQDELREIDSKRIDGKFMASDDSIPTGQAQVISLLEECYEHVHELIVTQDCVAGTLKHIYDRLIELKSQLENLVLTHRWTLRETDLWMYQIQLTEIDNMRKDGKFYDKDGNVPEGQTVLLYLLHKCYRLIYKLLSSSEPIAEPLMPIHNQLQTVRKFLKEIKKFGTPFTARELYPYQMKLASIDNLRVDGKFIDDDGSIPEGQGIIAA